MGGMGVVVSARKIRTLACSFASFVIKKGIEYEMLEGSGCVGWNILMFCLNL